jgi:peroxiredoxin
MPTTTIAGPSGADTPREKYEALLKDFDAQRITIPVLQDKLLALAMDSPDDTVAFEALGWVATHGPFSRSAGEAMGLLARDHARDERLGPVLTELDRLYGGSFKPLEDLCREAIRLSPHQLVRGWAGLVLARDIKARVEKADQRQALQAAKFKAAGPANTGPTELARLREEATALYGQLAAEFGDEVVGTAAKHDLHELSDLSVGSMAPEIEGKDVDGRRLRLGDYRGRVVLLDFSNHTGCGPCRAMYPGLRDLVRRYKDAPFALLGVNSGDAREILAKLRDEGEITWRLWVDENTEDVGTARGPISREWNIPGWPTVYVLDHRGVIRFKAASPIVGAPEAVIASLLEEMRAP